MQGLIFRRACLKRFDRPRDAFPGFKTRCVATFHECDGPLVRDKERPRSGLENDRVGGQPDIDFVHASCYRLDMWQTIATFGAVALGIVACMQALADLVNGADAWFTLREYKKSPHCLS